MTPQKRPSTRPATPRTSAWGVRTAVYAMGVAALALLVIPATAVADARLVGAAGVVLAAAYTKLVEGYFLARPRRRKVMVEPDNVQAMVAWREQRGGRLSLYDPATALLHRWYFEERVSEEVKRSSRYGTPMSVLAFRVTADVEEEASEPWETLIPRVAVASRRLVREVDLVASLGDHVYALCLPNTDEAGVMVVAQRLAEEFANYSWTAGHATCPTDASDAPALLRLAIDQLEGRGREHAA